MKYTRKVVKKICAHEAAIALAIDDKVLDDESKKIVDDLGADTLDVVELIMDIEDELNIAITEELASKIVTFGDLIDTTYNLVKNNDMTSFHDHLEND